MGLFYPDSYNQSREKEEFARAVFDAAPMAIVLVDAETRIIADLNPAAARLIGAAREEIVGRPHEDFIFPAVEYQPGNTDNSPRTTERVLSPAFGRPVAVINSTVPLKVGGRAHFLEFYIDISERKQAEEQLAGVNRELKNLNRQLRTALAEARQSAGSCRVRR